MSMHMEIHGSGQPLVMIHGWGMHAAVWYPLLPLLTPHFEVHLLDLPGMGYSQDCVLGDLDAVTATVAASLPASAHVCGWSLGGQVAMRLAQHYPQRVQKLVLIGSTPCFVNTPDWQHGIHAEVFQGFSASATEDSRATLLKFLTLQCMGASDSRDIVRQLREQFEQRPPAAQAALMDALHILLETDLRTVWPQLPQTTLLIHGDKDALAPVAAARWLAAQRPDSRLQVIAGATHAPFLSHRHDVAQLLLAFLQADAPAAAGAEPFSQPLVSTAS